MNDREIVTAALRWFTAHTDRMDATTASNKFKSDQKKRIGFGGANFELSRRVTAAKRLELAALRKLAKACERMRGQQIDDAIDVLAQTNQAGGLAFVGRDCCDVIQALDFYATELR